MANVKDKIKRERLKWVDPARTGILSAIGEDVVDPTFKVFPTVDPLKHVLKITLRRPISKETRPHLRTYLRLRAEQEGCELPIIRITDRWIQAEVLIGHRVWSRDEKGKFKKAPRRFERRPR